ncbi:MAG: DUF1538 domain-containing protein [Nitrospinaceae bacterium]|nr:DUF1538 domain-containing protein [Nitrospina sp.]MBT5375406.1 DUF1538 domain-containing protein [Nitrospinaceae bacterium]MBT5868675.1 DUF1538 domain-containing protein [Nitrospinaceae bacterium]MBT6346904.1 DUF1538 domain-containing protein [Nitrospina sp.]
MGREIRFGDFVREVSLKQNSLSYNRLTPPAVKDQSGQEIPYCPKKLQLRSIDVYRLLGPYVGMRLWSQVRAVVPLAVYLFLFQVLILRQNVLEHGVITAGLIAVILGLMIFMEGLKLGLMPFGEVIGNTLPKKSRLEVVLIITFLLGIGVTFAEPAIGALQAVGSIVDVRKAPYLYALLNNWTGALVLVVGIGVGLAAVLGTLRFLNGWSLKPMIYAAMIPTFGLTVFCMMDPELNKILGLAWDCGAVTTGPVTVPLVLSLGIGIASAAGKGNSSLSGFGIVTLASLFPIIGVLGLAIYVSFNVSPASIIEASQLVMVQTGTGRWQETPYAEILSGARSIVPLVLFLFLVLKVLLREKIHEPGILVYGLCLSLIGMIVFNIGLSYGLAKLGSQSGSFVPAAFIPLENVAGSPLYGYSAGIIIAVFFAWILGFGATLAEPALNALGQTVENLTNGAFRKGMLMMAVSTGVGFGISLGVLKIIFEIPISYLLLPGYILGLVLTACSSEEFVNVAWDSAGVTTGPVTVPLVLAMGLGFGNAVQAIEGFGILSMASICPILSVLIMGIWIQFKTRRANLKRINILKGQEVTA